jgi:hypothetical protein
VTETIEIFVLLLDEGVDVWRPVQAEHCGGNVYKIVEQTYDSEMEKWEFEPGDFVECKTLDLNEGPALVAAALHKL